MQTWTHRWLVELVQHPGQRRASIPALRTSEQRWAGVVVGKSSSINFIERDFSSSRALSKSGLAFLFEERHYRPIGRCCWMPNAAPSTHTPVTERQLPESGARWFKHGQREKVFAWETGASPERVRVHTVDIHTVEQSLQTLFLFFLSFLF